MPVVQTPRIMSTSLVEARGVGVELGGNWLIRDISFAVRAGETVTVMGPNGAGKTTLIRTMLGLVRDYRGSVHRRAGLRAGYVPSRYTPSAHIPLTVARFMSLTRRCGNAQAEEALEMTGALAPRNACLSELSRGELQRVLLARALVGDAELMVLDEPLQGVDINSISDLYAEICEVARRRGRGVLMASHDLHDVLPHTDHLLCINGSLLCAGSPQEVLDEPAFRELFGSHLRNCEHPVTCAPAPEQDLHAG